MESQKKKVSRSQVMRKLPENATLHAPREISLCHRVERSRTVSREDDNLTPSQRQLKKVLGRLPVTFSEANKKLHEMRIKECKKQGIICKNKPCVPSEFPEGIRARK